MIVLRPPFFKEKINLVEAGCRATLIQNLLSICFLYEI